MIEDGTSMNKADFIEKKISLIFQKIDLDEVYFPSGNDSHIDHIVVHNIVKKIICKADFKVEAYCYSITQKYNRVGPIFDRIKNIFIKNMVQTDISEYVTVKKRALEEYQSQISIVSSRQKRPVYTFKHLGNIENFYILEC